MWKVISFVQAFQKRFEREEKGFANSKMLILLCIMEIRNNIFNQRFLFLIQIRKCKRKDHYFL